MDATEGDDVFNFIRALKEKLRREQKLVEELSTENMNLRAQVENPRLRAKLIPLREEGCDDG